VQYSAVKVAQSAVHCSIGGTKCSCLEIFRCKSAVKVQYGTVKKCSQVEEVCTLLDLGALPIKCQLESPPMEPSLNCFEYSICVS
jgi:hypothetical protein